MLKRKIIELDESCKTCLKYKKKDLRPIVGFSLASDFNECIAMDLKQIEDTHIQIFHIIDVATRFSAGCIVT